MIITIDGPTASGKSTIARLVADQLGIYYLNSGLLYRALAYVLRTKAGYSTATITQPQQKDVVTYLDQKKLRYRYSKESGARIIFEGNDITEYLKQGDIDEYASLVSTNPYVRNMVDAMQRTLASQHDFVADGRDTGSVVFPQAGIKFYLTASIPVRAQRWLQAQSKKDLNYSFDQAVTEITTRDERDKNRSVAPLIIPEGAQIVDSSELSISQTVSVFLNYIYDKKKGRD